MSCGIFRSPASFAYLKFEIHLFTLRTIEGLKHNYYKRFKHSLMLQKNTRCIKSWGGGDFWTGWRCPNFSYFVEIFFFLYCPSEATEDTCMFPGRQIKCNLPWSSNTKRFHPPALNGSCFLLEDQWMFEPFLIVVFESLNCPQSEKMVLKIIQSLLERVQICKRCWKTEESAGHGGFFWRTELSLTVQNKQGTHEQPSQKNKKTHTHY